VIAAATPDAALLRWVQAVPAVRCAAPAFRAWTGGPDASPVPFTPVAGDRYARSMFSPSAYHGLTQVAGMPGDMSYFAARVPSANALVLHAEAAEDNFVAVVAEPPAPPPRALVTLSAAPRAHGLGLRSTRADVERALGAGRAKTMCGYDVVRYRVEPPAASVAEMWFFYRGGIVAALARYEAV
jgi:hypothetical protein